MDEARCACAPRSRPRNGLDNVTAAVVVLEGGSNMGTKADWVFEPGDRVRSTSADADDECGRIIEIFDNGTCVVAWDQGIRTPRDLGSLAYENAAMQAFAEAAS